MLTEKEELEDTRERDLEGFRTEVEGWKEKVRLMEQESRVVSENSKLKKEYEEKELDWLKKIAKKDNENQQLRGGNTTGV